MIREPTVRRLLLFAVALMALAHYAVLLARLLMPLLAGAALLAVIGLAFWLILIAPFRNRI
jgi:hypothetical protein